MGTSTSASLLMQTAAVAAGGAIGSVGRFLISVAARKLSSWSVTVDAVIGTFAVNLIGSFAIGLLAAWFLNQPDDRTTLRLFLITGILGGFTTFSAFSLETLDLMNEHRVGAATTYALGSVVLGLVLALVGWRIGLAAFGFPASE